MQFAGYFNASRLYNDFSKKLFTPVSISRDQQKKTHYDSISRANLQANSKNSKNLAPVPPIRQTLLSTTLSTTTVTESKLPSRRASGPSTNSSLLPPKPLGPQRSNTTLTPRNAPMAAVSPVMDDGKLKSRANSPDYPKHLLKRQSSKDGEGYESDFPVK